MKNFSIAYRPIVVGTICGLIMLCTWSQRTVMLTQPTWALAMFAGLASLAGVVVGGVLSRAGEAIDKAVRLGGKSAVVATLVASASFALMARKLPGDFSAIRGFLIPLVCALPVILVGSMAAALGALTCRCAEGSDEKRVAPAVIEPPRYFKFCSPAA